MGLVPNVIPEISRSITIEYKNIHTFKMFSYNWYKNGKTRVVTWEIVQANSSLPWDWEHKRPYRDGLSMNPNMAT